MYQIEVDTHTHTLASPHAYSTITENCNYAKEKGHPAVAMTDHGPAISDSPNLLHFANMRILPDKINGIILIKGAELTIMDKDGSVDIPDNILKNLDWVIASMHYPILSELTYDEITDAYINAIKNPYIDCIGHMGQPKFKCDYDRIIKEVKKYNKIIEINNNSPVVRVGSVEHCINIALLCKKHNVRICVSSDAHFHTMIGNYDKAFEILRSVDFPSDLILNNSFLKFKEYIDSKKEANN